MIISQGIMVVLKKNCWFQLDVSTRCSDRLPEKNCTINHKTILSDWAFDLPNHSDEEVDHTLDTALFGMYHT